jgi:hypothetical protein
MKNKIQEEVEKIEIPQEVSQSVKIGVKRAKITSSNTEKHKRKEKNWYYNKLVTITGAAIVILSLLVGSIVVSPKMSEVASKVPYLKHILDSKDLINSIDETLNQEEYTSSVDIKYFPDKEVVVKVDTTPDIFINEEDKIEVKVQTILNEYGYNDFEVLVKRGNETTVNNHQIPTERIELADKVTRSLKAKGYPVIEVGFKGKHADQQEQYMEVNIPGTEKRTEEIENFTKKILKEENKDEKYPVKIKTINLARKEIEHNWNDILSSLNDALIGNGNYPVKSVGYSIVNRVYHINITLSLREENPEVQKHVKLLEKDIVGMLNSEDTHNDIEQNNYKINIYSEDKILLN